MMTTMAAEKKIIKKIIAHLLEDPEQEPKLLTQLCFSDDDIKTISLAESASVLFSHFSGQSLTL